MNVLYRVILIACSLLSLSTPAWADTTISITGSVTQPLYLSLADMEGFGSHATVRLNEAYRDGSFHGVFSCHGPTLQSLLDLAGIKKEGAEFVKKVDMALVVRNARGEQAVLSWGEVFFRNPAEIIIATKAVPIIPMLFDEMRPDWKEQMKRSIEFPKLVIAHDFYTDRCLEDITGIEVVHLDSEPKGKKGDPFSATHVVVSGEGIKPLEVKELSDFDRIEVPTKHVGPGKGFHGCQMFTGARLVDILAGAGLEPEPASFLLASSTDGYRSLISWGELFQTPAGHNIMIADTLDGTSTKEKNMGAFTLVFPHDLASDRCVKGLSTIEVISVKRKPTLYVISVGCSQSDLITLEALSAFAKADAFVCSEEQKNQYARYIGDRPILFDPFQSLREIIHKEHPELSAAEKKEHLKGTKAAEAKIITQAMSQGKSVAYLEYGDPAIYGSGRFFQDYVNKDQLEIIPGISAFNASNALLERDISGNGSIIISSPKGLSGNEAMIKAVADNGDTLVIFMGLKDMTSLVPLLDTYYPASTPACLVYNAGLTAKEKVVRTTLADLLSAAQQEQEQWLGLIYVGEKLK